MEKRPQSDLYVLDADEQDRLLKLIKINPSFFMSELVKIIKDHPTMVEYLLGCLDKDLKSEKSKLKEQADKLGQNTYKGLLEELPFNKAKKVVHSLRLKSGYEWYNLKDAVSRIPKHPNIVYKAYWKGWDDWLGKFDTRLLQTEYEGSRKINKRTDPAYLTIQMTVRKDLRKEAYRRWDAICPAGAARADFWEYLLRKYLQEGDHETYHVGNDEVEASVPLQTDVKWYQDQFKPLFDTLRLEKNHKPKSKRLPILPFKEARKVARTMEISNSREWRKAHRPSGLPSHPERIYAKTGDWVNWSDWLGREEDTNSIQSILEPETSSCDNKTFDEVFFFLNNMVNGDKQ